MSKGFLGIKYPVTEIETRDIPVWQMRLVYFRVERSTRVLGLG